jgi:hypothetical protein
LSVAAWLVGVPIDILRRKVGPVMDAKVVGKDLVELQLNPSDFYLSEKKLRELIKLLERKLFELKDFERAAILAEKQLVLSLGL